MAADLVAFDPATVRERSTFADPTHYSEGVPYVAVNGLVVDDRKILPPGREDSPRSRLQGSAVESKTGYRFAAGPPTLLLGGQSPRRRAATMRIHRQSYALVGLMFISQLPQLQRRWG
jgi:hypothetical protein